MSEVDIKDIKKLYEQCIESQNDRTAQENLWQEIMSQVEVQDFFDTSVSLSNEDVEALTVAEVLDLQIKYGNGNKQEIKDIINGIIPALQSNNLEQLLEVEEKWNDFKKNNPEHQFVKDFNPEHSIGTSLDQYDLKNNVENRISKHPDLQNFTQDLDKVLKVGEKLEKFAERLNKLGDKKITIKFGELSKDIDSKIQSFNRSDASNQEITEFMIAMHDAKPFLKNKGVDIDKQMYDLELLRSEVLATPDIFEKNSVADIVKIIETESKKVGADKQNDEKLNGKESCLVVLSSIPYESWGKMQEVAKELDKRESARGSAIGRVVQNFSDAIASFVSAVKSIGNSTKNKELKSLSKSFEKSL